MAKPIVERVREIIEKRNVDCLLFTDLSNIFYISRFKGFEGIALIVPKDGAPKLYVPKLEYERALEESKNTEVHVYEERFEKTIKEALEECKCNKVGLPYYKVSFWLISALSKNSDNIKFVDVSKDIMSVRSVKTFEEINAIKKAIKITEIGFAVALESLREGIRELELAAKIEYAFKTNGSLEVAFPSIVASGTNSALPHAIASTKPIRKGELIVVDIGAKYEGYCGDLTRTLSLGSVSEKLKDIFYAVLEAQKEAIKNIRPEIRASEADSIARNVLKEYGYEKYFIHSLGHGIGVDVHEFPRLSSKSDEILKPGMVVTVEPGVYIKGLGGVRIEDDVLITESGNTILSTYPRDLII